MGETSQRIKVLEFMIHFRKEYIRIQTAKGEVWCKAGPIADELARAEKDIKRFSEELVTLAEAKNQTNPLQQ